MYNLQTSVHRLPDKSRLNTGLRALVKLAFLLDPTCLIMVERNKDSHLVDYWEFLGRAGTVSLIVSYRTPSVHSCIYLLTGLCWD